MARSQIRPVQFIGRYRVEGLLGRGAWGTVYLASRKGMDRKVAVKLLNLQPEDDPEVIERFRREGQAAVAITHQGIPSVFEVGTAENGAPFLVMEFLDGETLRAFSQRHEKVPPGVASALLLPVLAVLDSAHTAGIVHRDLKPSNIMLLGGARREVKVLDFGMAKLLSEALTRPGTPMGTPLYMAPEQVLNSKAASPASDLYSVGVLLYQLLSGTTPFHGNNMMDVMSAVVRTPPPPLATHCPDLHPQLLGLVDALLSKQPEERRPSTAAAVRERLSELAPPDVEGLWSRVKESPHERHEEAPTQQAQVDLTLRAEPPAGFVFKPIHAVLGVAGLALLVGGGLLADSALDHPAPARPTAASTPARDTSSVQTVPLPAPPPPPPPPPPVVVESPADQKRNAELLMKAEEATKRGHIAVARALLDKCLEGAGTCRGAETLLARLRREETFANDLDAAEQALAEESIDSAQTALDRAKETQTWAARKQDIENVHSFVAFKVSQDLKKNRDKANRFLSSARAALARGQLSKARKDLTTAIKERGGDEPGKLMGDLLAREKQEARRREAAVAKKHRLFELEKDLRAQAGPDVRDRE